MSVVLGAAHRVNDAHQTLLRAIRGALNGGANATKLAAALGVSEGTVRRWAAEGLPRPFKLDP